MYHAVVPAPIMISLCRIVIRTAKMRFCRMTLLGSSSVAQRRRVAHIPRSDMGKNVGNMDAYERHCKPLQAHARHIPARRTPAIRKTYDIAGFVVLGRTSAESC